MYAVPLIALLSDFGTVDTYVGSMKGVITNISPGVPMIDLTHEIPPGDIRRGAINLWKELPYFPPKTIFLCIIDPGVGTSRRGILVKSGDFYFIGPDNGLFSYVIKPGAEVWHLKNPDYQLPEVFTTFHGRDIFAPAAAHLARGVSPKEFGPPVSDPVQIPYPRMEARESNSLLGEILYSDRYGNLLTSLGRFRRSGEEIDLIEPWMPGGLKVTYKFDKLRSRLPDGTILSWANTFDEVGEGKCAILLGSSGLIEIVARRESAEILLGLNGGEIITMGEFGDQ